MSTASTRWEMPFDRWQALVIVLAAFVSTAAVIPASPLVGLVGFVVAVASWAGVVSLLALGNGAVVARVGHRLPGVMTSRLYCLAAGLGLLAVTVNLARGSPSAWGHLVGRFTPEIAVYGFVVGGSAFALVCFVLAWTFERWSDRDPR